MPAARYLLMLATGFLAGAATTAALSEATPPAVVVVDFMMTKPDTAESYVALERGPWKAVHEERIRRGLMQGWQLYERRYPQGTGEPYHYVTVNAFATFEDAERDPLALFDEVHPNLSQEDVMRRTLASRELLRGEIWRLLDAAGEIPGP